MNNNMQQETIDNMSDLIKLSIDSVHGFRECAEMVADENSALKGYLNDCAIERNNMVNELKTSLRLIDSQNDILNKDDRSIQGTMHQYFAKFKSMFENDSEAALEEISRGESHLLNEFDKALQKDIVVEQRQVLQNIRNSIANKKQKIEDLERAA